jgi:hypothetical protein
MEAPCGQGTPVARATTTLQSPAAEVVSLPRIGCRGSRGRRSPLGSRAWRSGVPVRALSCVLLSKAPGLRDPGPAAWRCLGRLRPRSPAQAGAIVPGEPTPHATVPCGSESTGPHSWVSPWRPDSRPVLQHSGPPKYLLNPKEKCYAQA